MPLEKSAALRSAKTGAGRRAVGAREPKILENPKSLLLLKGHRTSQQVTNVLRDLHLLKKPLCRKFQRKNNILPFEAGGDTHLENLCRLSDCSLFALGNHNKKRPNNLVLGRLFDGRILDMLELGVTEYRGVHKHIKSAAGSAPLLLFNGDDFDQNEQTRTLRSLLADIFRAPADMQKLNLGGVDRLMTFTLVEDTTVQIRHYQLVLRRKLGSDLPRPELEEVGPSIDLALRRSHIAPDDLWKEAMKKPRDPREDWVTKNISKNEMGDKQGRIHLGKQDLSGLALARQKALKKKRHRKNGEVEEKSEEDIPATKKTRVE